MPEDATAEGELVQQYQTAVEKLTQPATLAEAEALIAVLPEGEWSLFGAAWAVLHFIETAPGWPDPTVMHGDGHWVTLLRERAEQRGSIVLRRDGSIWRNEWRMHGITITGRFDDGMSLDDVKALVDSAMGEEFGRIVIWTDGDDGSGVGEFWLAPHLMRRASRYPTWGSAS
jgi:hypothetical protein